MPATATATGPKTDSGKAASSLNAIRHGLTAKQIVLPGEDPAEYDALRQSLIDAHCPAEGLESILIDQIAQCVWRLNRARRMETEALEVELTNPEPEANPRMDKMMRYMAAIEREFHRSVRELNNMQSARARNSTAEMKAKTQSELIRLQHEMFASVPDIPPLTEEDVIRIHANRANSGNYETNPSETGRVLADTSIIQNYETNPADPDQHSLALTPEFRHARIQS